MPTLTITMIEKAQPNPDKEITLWDDRVKGLGCRIRPSGKRTFVVMYRSPETGKLTRLTLGAFGPVTLDAARTRAKKALGEVADGKDPAREKRRKIELARVTGRTMSELADDYLRDANAGYVTYRGRPKKPSTLAIDAGRVERHIKPLLGSKLVADITPADVTAFYHDIRLGKGISGEFKGKKRGKARVTGGATTAARTVDLLGSIFSYSVRNGLRPDNPVARFERPPTRRRDRVLSPAEYGALGKALLSLEEEYKPWETVIAAIRVLALTGLRRSEAFNLRWAEVDAENCVLRLTETKAGGPQVRPIGRAAMDLITSMPREEGSQFVFPSEKGTGPIVSPKAFVESVKRAGLEGVTIHTFRHSFASVANGLDFSEFTIGGMLGHRSHSVTARYVHTVDKALVTAADRVSKRIARFLAGKAEESKEDNVEYLRTRPDVA